MSTTMMIDTGQRPSSPEIADLPTTPVRRFSAGSSKWQRRMSIVAEKEKAFGPSMNILYLGFSAMPLDDSTIAIAVAVHDTVYLVDFSVRNVSRENIGVQSDGRDLVADHIISKVEAYEHDHIVKFVGAGLPQTMLDISPTLCSRLWLSLDIVPVVMRPDEGSVSVSAGGSGRFWGAKSVDEQADSMARKCIMNFGPSLVPLLQVGFRGIVQIDAGYRARLVRLQDYEHTCGETTWAATLKYAQKLRDNKIRVAFFSSTPQGGGVALMRHALMRLSRLMGVEATWYVPKPKPGVFRITKNMHNILQGVSDPNQRITPEEKDNIRDWILDNAHRYWLSDGGPLKPPEEGGAHVIIVDDPQMPCIIPLIKESTPNRPVIYRSHIQIRSDLVAQPGSPQADIWDFLWSSVRHADMFISHPIPEFVPFNVPREKVAYMPATTDWLDGLNKELNRWDTGYYGHIYNLRCHSQRMAELEWPARKYIAQVARFDPSKGIPTVVDAYAEFRRLCAEKNITDVPQLCICGNGSIDDPDGTAIFDQAMDQIESKYPHLAPDCSILRLDPNDQLLNTILSNAHVVLQLSTREGFEVKVSEALHAGRPVIATRAGGIPIQVRDGVTGYLVEPGDWRGVAARLVDLFADENLHDRMSLAAKLGVSDEVGTVGNALAWYYLAAKWAEVGVKPGLKGNERWVNDMAREEIAMPYEEMENRLPREFTMRKAAQKGSDKPSAEWTEHAPVGEQRSAVQT